MTTTIAGRMQVHTVTGGGGVRLHVREWGNADGPPILFIHGWSQNHLCWDKQYESALRDEFRLVAFDLRGHGMSEAPPGPGPYTDDRLWADDLAAIIEPAGPRARGARRLVLRRLRHLRLHPRVRPGPGGRDQLRRGRGQAGRGGVRHADRPRFPRPLRGRHGRRPAGQHPRHARLRPGVPGQAGRRRGLRDRAVLEHGGGPAGPRRPRRARDRRRRRAARPRGAAAGHPGPFGHGGAPGDGRTRPGHLPDRRGLLVRRRRPRAAPGGARPLQPRAGRADPARVLG